MEKSLFSSLRRVVLVGTFVMTFGICMLHIYRQNVMTLKTAYPQSTTGRRQKVLFILTQTRSGSSFTAEIFAATNNSLYFYEPLHPFRELCKYKVEKEALLKQILSCDFAQLKNVLSTGFEQTKLKDVARCKANGVCFVDASTGLLRTYAKVCQNMSKFEEKLKSCGRPLRPDVLKRTCLSSDLLITKVTRICTLEEIEKIYKFLKTFNKDTYILHLVRDLRSIASSHLKMMGQKQVNKINNVIKDEYCYRQRHNLNYIKTTADSALLTDGRYLRVRYEDLSTDAVGQAEKVFKFMGSSLPPEVVNKIHNYLHPSKEVIKLMNTKGKSGVKMAGMRKQYKNRFGVVRDPTKILNGWRTLVPFHQVQAIQQDCGDVLKELGYVMFSSKEQMEDLSNPAFIDPPV